MTSRRIPIGTGHRAPPARPQPASHFQSSLDLVFSFSRSQAFFGSNLPSSPSFVARYRRPGFPDDEESSIAPSDADGGPEGRTTSDDGTRGGEESIATTDDESWSEDEIDARAISWDSDVPPRREQLPRNAVRRQSGSRPPARRQESSDASTSQSDRQPHFAYGSTPNDNALHARLGERASGNNERAPLLAPLVARGGVAGGGGRDSSASGSPPDSVPFPRRTSLVTAALLAHNKAAPIGGGPGLRRLSVISGEGWKAAMEESRGLSTYGQTLFNTVNVLIGVGLLAEPLAFADAGWLFGTGILLFCALVTNYTAKMLARIMSQDQSLLTYSDVLIKAYGPRARSLIHLLFCMELSAVSIALVVLFSDSMSSLFPSRSSDFFKIVSFFVILPTTFLPLRFLSLTSLVGIISSFVLLFVLLTDGVIKRHSPGSLWEPMPTNLTPRWPRFPLSFGLLMSGFAGHAVIPSLYRDMKNPRSFNSMINTAYAITFVVSFLIGVMGFLMFGNTVSDEITRDMKLTSGYPPFLNKVAVWMIAINPVVKYALASSPLISTVEHLTGLSKVIQPLEPQPLSSQILDGSAIVSDGSSISLPQPLAHPAPPPPPSSDAITLRSLIHFAIRPLIMALIVLSAILIPNFGIVLSFLGSSSAFIICAIGPIGAYLILGLRKEPADGIRRRVVPAADEAWVGIGKRERWLCWTLLVISIGLASVGTVWTALPVPEVHPR